MPSLSWVLAGRTCHFVCYYVAQLLKLLKHYKWSKHLKFRISNVQIICIYNEFIHVQWCTELSYLFISGYDLHRQLFATKPSIVCVHDNVRKRVFAIFLGMGRGSGDVPVACTTLPNLPLLAQSKRNKTNKTPHKHSYMYKRLKFISFQCAPDVSVISIFFFFFFRNLVKIQVCIETRWTLVFTYKSVINPEYTAIILFCRLKFDCLRGKTV